MKTPRQPNIVWIMAEDMGLDLECYGMKGVSTPNLNKFAEEGVQYRNAFCTNPICSPSRSAMMVGAHQVSIGAHNHRSKRETPLTAPYEPITAHLRRAGYTCILGHKDVQLMGQKTDCNFKHDKVGPYDGKTQFGLFDKLNEALPEDAPFYHHIQLNVTHRGDWWEEVRAGSEKPVDVHEVELPPYIADTEINRLDWAAYLDTVEYMDREFGMLMADLEEKGLADNTYVVFIADNGRCQIRGKGYLYEPGLHIPMLVRGPGIEAGVIEERVVSTLDICASIFEWAGIEAPAYLEGRPVIGKKDFQGREYIYGARDIWDEINECSRSVCDGRYNLIHNRMPEVPWDAHQAYLDFYRPVVHEMRRLKEQGKLDEKTGIFFQDRKPELELYDWARDPHEMNNLADCPEAAEVLRKMRAMMEDYQRSHRDMGLEDLDDRHPMKKSPYQVRNWLQQTDPARWEAVTKEVFVKFQALEREFKALLAKEEIQESNQG